MLREAMRWARSVDSPLSLLPWSPSAQPSTEDTVSESIRPNARMGAERHSSRTKSCRKSAHNPPKPESQSAST
jgi:hypothetical protein